MSDQNSVDAFRERQRARQHAGWDDSADHWAGDGGLEQIKALEREIENAPLASRAMLEKRLSTLLGHREASQKEQKQRKPSKLGRLAAYGVAYVVGVGLGLWGLANGISPGVAAVALCGIALPLGVAAVAFRQALRRKMGAGRDGGRAAQLSKKRDWRAVRVLLLCALAPATLPLVYATAQRVGVMAFNRAGGHAAQTIASQFTAGSVAVSTAGAGPASAPSAAAETLAKTLAERASETVAAAGGNAAGLPGAHALALATLSGSANLGGRAVSPDSARMVYGESAGAALAAGASYPGHLKFTHRPAGLWITAQPTPSALRSSDDRGVVASGAWFIPFFSDAQCTRLALDFPARDQAFATALLRAGKTGLLGDWQKARAEHPAIDERVACVGAPVAVSGLAPIDRSDFSFRSDLLDQGGDFSEAIRAFEGRAASGVSGLSAAQAALAARDARMSIDQRQLGEESRTAP